MKSDTVSEEFAKFKSYNLVALRQAASLLTAMKTPLSREFREQLSDSERQVADQIYGALVSLSSSADHTLEMLLFAEDAVVQRDLDWLTSVHNEAVRAFHEREDKEHQAKSGVNDA